MVSDNVIELRPQSEHDGCPNCDDVWVTTRIVVNRDGSFSAREAVGKCASCGVERQLPGEVVG